jgi:serine/threonine-protein phosphatase 4 catalytic subunit
MNISDLDKMIDTLKKNDLIKESEVKSLCLKAKEILVKEDNVEQINAPVTVKIKKYFKFLSILKL